VRRITVHGTRETCGTLLAALDAWATSSRRRWRMSQVVGFSHVALACGMPDLNPWEGFSLRTASRHVEGAEVLGEAAAELAAAGGTALVTAMVTDGWESFKARFARLLGRGNAEETEAVAVQLDETQAMLVARVGADLERARAEQQLAWRIRLGDALERQPAAENELRPLIAEIQAFAQAPAVSIVQNVTGFDRAQQAVQGQGNQVNTFGSQDG
jgi:hypothetical protein